MLIPASAHALEVKELVDASTQDLIQLEAAAIKKLQAVQKLTGQSAETPAEDDSDKDALKAAGQTTDADSQDEQTATSLKRSNEKRLGEHAYAARLPQQQNKNTSNLKTDSFSKLQEKLKLTLASQEQMSLLEEFVNSQPKHRDARITLARLLVMDERSHQALAVLSPLLTPIQRNSHPDWQPWFWAGTAYVLEANVDQARDHLEVALAKNSQKIEVWVQLAVLEQEQGNHAAALQNLTIAAQLDPESPHLLLNRAYSLEHLGRYQEAMNAYQQFLVADSTVATTNIRPSILRRIGMIAAHHQSLTNVETKLK